MLPPGAANVTELDSRRTKSRSGAEKIVTSSWTIKKPRASTRSFAAAGVNFSIKDLDSANGTYVNDEKVAERDLSGDDILKIGNVEFRFLGFELGLRREPRQVHAGARAAGGRSDWLQSGGSSGFQCRASHGRIRSEIPSPAWIRTQVFRGWLELVTRAPVKKPSSKIESAAQAAPNPDLADPWPGCLGGLMEDDAPTPPPKKAASSPRIRRTKSPATFESLTPEQKKFVESQHALAFDYYKNRDYDKTLFEIQKIFALIPDYKDSREIERYAKEGKRKLEALEDEKRKKEAEEKLKNEIAALVEQAKGLMDQKKYDEAKEIFPQILALDPDNQQVPTGAVWSISSTKTNGSRIRKRACRIRSTFAPGIFITKAWA